MNVDSVVSPFRVTLTVRIWGTPELGLKPFSMFANAISSFKFVIFGKRSKVSKKARFTALHDTSSTELRRAPRVMGGSVVISTPEFESEQLMFLNPQLPTPPLFSCSSILGRRPVSTVASKHDGRSWGPFLTSTFILDNEFPIPTDFGKKKMNL